MIAKQWVDPESTSWIHYVIHNNNADHLAAAYIDLNINNMHQVLFSWLAIVQKHLVMIESVR